MVEYQSIVLNIVDILVLYKLVYERLRKKKYFIYWKEDNYDLKNNDEIRTLEEEKRLYIYILN